MISINSEMFYPKNIKVEVEDVRDLGRFKAFFVKAYRRKTFLFIRFPWKVFYHGNVIHDSLINSWFSAKDGKDLDLDFHVCMNNTREERQLNKVAEIRLKYLETSGLFK